VFGGFARGILGIEVFDIGLKHFVLLLRVRGQR